MLFAQTLHQRTPLLKLAQRSSMEPHVLRVRVHLLPQNTEGFPLAAPHLPDLLIEKAVDGYTQEVEIYSNVIHQPSTSIARFILFMVSSLPKKAEISNMPGPLPSPTRVRRQAFITLPNLYSFCSTHA